MAESLYQLLVLGRPDTRSDRVFAQLQARLGELGLAPGTIEILAEANAGRRATALPAVALFTGYEGASDAAHAALDPLLADSITIITLVSDLQRVSRELPERLRHINALPVAPDQNIDRVVFLGSHDGFPSYSVLIDGKIVYDYEQNLFIEAPAELMGTSDIAVDREVSF